MHVSSVISMLNCIPSASTDRMLRIIEAAKAQVKEEGVKKTVGDGLTRGSLCAVLFDNDDGTGDDPSTVWYGFVRRYGVRVGTRFKEWMKPVDFDADTVDEKLVLQFTWLAVSTGVGHLSRRMLLSPSGPQGLRKVRSVGCVGGCSYSLLTFIFKLLQCVVMVVLAGVCHHSSHRLRDRGRQV